MIIKRQFNPIRVIGYVKTEMLYALLISSMVFALYEIQWIVVGLPFAIAAILGSALAIFIAFRNNTSYSRWWEARTQWGTIVNACRVYGRLVITFTDSHRQQPNYEAERSNAFKHDMIYLMIAWVHSLRLQLRALDYAHHLHPYLTEKDRERILQTHQKTNAIQLVMGERIYEAMSSGVLAGFDSFQIEGQLATLTNAQGACERIKNTPLLRQYDYFTRVFMYVFITLLPFTLAGDFAKLGLLYWLIPICAVISFVFAIIGKVGEVNEDPFENRITDVPLDAICNTIERDLREMLGEKDLPAKHLPQQGFLS